MACTQHQASIDPTLGQLWLASQRKACFCWPVPLRTWPSPSHKASGKPRTPPQHAMAIPGHWPSSPMMAWRTTQRPTRLEDPPTQAQASHGLFPCANSPTPCSTPTSTPCVTRDQGHLSTGPASTSRLAHVLRPSHLPPTSSSQTICPRPPASSSRHASLAHAWTTQQHAMHAAHAMNSSAMHTHDIPAYRPCPYNHAHARATHAL